MPVASSVRNQMMRLFRKKNKKGKGLVNNQSTGSTSINTANSCYSELSEDNSSQIFKRSKSRRGSKLFRSIRKRFSRSKSYLQAVTTATPHATTKLGESSASITAASKGNTAEDECDCKLSKRGAGSVGGAGSGLDVWVAGSAKAAGGVHLRETARIRRRNSKRENRNSCPPPLRQIADDEEASYSFNSGDSECGDGKAPLLVPGCSSRASTTSSQVPCSSSRLSGDMKKDLSPVVVVVEPPAEYCDPQVPSEPTTVGIPTPIPTSPTDQGKSVDSKMKEPGTGGTGAATTPSSATSGGGGGEPSSASSSRRPSVEMSGAPRAELSVHGPNSSNSSRGASASGGGGVTRKSDGATTVTDGASASKKSDGPGRPPSGSSASGPRQVDRNFGNVRRGGGRKVRWYPPSVHSLTLVSNLCTLSLLIL